MDKVVDIIAIFFAVGLPVTLIFGRPFIRQWFDLRHRQLEVDARLAAEKAAQYAVSNVQLEERVRVLEKIVTDSGYDTAARIEALREPRLTGGDKV